VFLHAEEGDVTGVAGRRAPMHMQYDLFLTLVLVVALLVLTTGRTLTDAHSLSAALKDRFTPPSHLASLEDVWAYMGSVVVPAVYEPWYRVDVVNGSVSARGLGASVALSPPRVRQVRVRAGEVAEECGVPVQAHGVVDVCARVASPEAEDRATYGQAGAIVAAGIEDAYVFTSPQETRAAVVAGEAGVYPAGGYVWHMPATLKEARDQADDLLKLGWLDARTRLLEVIRLLCAYVVCFVAARDIT
jgi:hypothetical protein